jgi:hypothetical protein
MDPFFIWVIILWYAALKQLLTISKEQKTTLLVIMILFPFALVLLRIIFSVMIFNVINPAS